MNSKSSLALEDGLSLSKLFTTGSILHINEIYNDEDNPETISHPAKTVDFVGKPVKSFADLESSMIPVDSAGLVKKKFIEEGGGAPLNEACTVEVAFSGYWENELEPFDVRKADKPLVVDLNESVLLPGLHMAVQSMLVGEMSVFLLSYEVMYGELGNPPRIKPKSNCIFYIRLIKSILTDKRKAVSSEHNMFQKIYHEVKQLYASGVTLYKSNNCPAALNLFRKAIFMLHRCRLADEHEEKIQEHMLKKLYINIAICSNLNRQPLKACVACNELHRLNSLWNNGKVLYQNAKALRMIGQFKEAQKKILRAKKLCPNCKLIDDEIELLRKTWDSCNQSTLFMESKVGRMKELVSDDFKREVDKLIKSFKENMDLCKLTLPGDLTSEEVRYIKEACLRENLFFTKIQKDFALDKDEGTKTEEDPSLNE